jgi:hypothetical protein
MDFTQDIEDDESAIGSESTVDSIATDDEAPKDDDAVDEHAPGEVAAAVCDPEPESESSNSSNESVAAEPAPKEARHEGPRPRGTRKLVEGGHVRKEPPTNFKIRAVREWKKLTQLPDNQTEGFHTYLYRLLNTGKLRWVLNFDEVPMSLSGSMGKLKSPALTTRTPASTWTRTTRNGAAE